MEHTCIASMSIFCCCSFCEVDPCVQRIWTCVYGLCVCWLVYRVVQVSHVWCCVCLIEVTHPSAGRAHMSLCCRFACVCVCQCGAYCKVVHLFGGQETNDCSYVVFVCLCTANHRHFPSSLLHVLSRWPMFWQEMHKCPFIACVHLSVWSVLQRFPYFFGVCVLKFTHVYKGYKCVFYVFVCVECTAKSFMFWWFGLIKMINLSAGCSWWLLFCFVYVCFVSVALSAKHPLFLGMCCEGNMSVDRRWCLYLLWVFVSLFVCSLALRCPKMAYLSAGHVQLCLHTCVLFVCLYMSICIIAQHSSKLTPSFGSTAICFILIRNNFDPQ